MPHAQLQFAIKHQNKQPKHAGEQTQRHYIYRCHPTRVFGGELDCGECNSSTSTYH